MEVHGTSYLQPHNHLLAGLKIRLIRSMTEVYLSSIYLLYYNFFNCDNPFPLQELCFYLLNLYFINNGTLINGRLCQM